MNLKLGHQNFFNIIKNPKSKLLRFYIFQKQVTFKFNINNILILNLALTNDVLMNEKTC